MHSLHAHIRRIASATCATTLFVIAVIVVTPRCALAGPTAAHAGTTDTQRLLPSTTALPGQTTTHATTNHDPNLAAVALLDAGHDRRAARTLQSIIARDPDDTWAMVALGHLIALGLGTRRDPHAAFAYFLRAAQGGNMDAQRIVANAYLNGNGVAPDMQKAAYWFRVGMAVPQLVNADYWLGQIYGKGVLVPADARKLQYYQQRSRQWLMPLGQLPDGAAAYDIGLMYANGEGVTPNARLALRWLRRAEALHYPRAPYALRRLARRMESHHEP